METKKVTITWLHASEGMYLTQAGDVNINERDFAVAIALGKNDSAANWIEITKEQTNEYKKQQRAAHTASKTLTKVRTAATEEVPLFKSTKSKKK